MRKVFIVPLILMGQLALGQGKGIDFEENSWKNIIKKAKAENKLIFFDAYTSWCGPCIRLQNGVFPNHEVGGFYNKNFVNAKFDMEKGEGIQLSRKYSVQVYPTLLFIDPNTEKVVNQSVGYKTPVQLIQLGEASIQKGK